MTETGRRARFDRLTNAGRAQLEAETASWRRLSAALLTCSTAVDAGGPG